MRVMEDTLMRREPQFSCDPLNALNCDLHGDMHTANDRSVHFNACPNHGIGKTEGYMGVSKVWLYQLHYIYQPNG